jgi:hypothetical protein
MKKWFWTGVAGVHGGFFLFHGFSEGSLGLLTAGSALMGLFILSILDETNVRQASRQALTALSKTTSQAAGQLVQAGRVVQVVQTHEYKIQDLLSRIEALERVPSDWQRIGRQLATPTFKVTDYGMIFVYDDAHTNTFSEALSMLPSQVTDSDESAVIITDFGSSQVTLNNLMDFAEEKIDLEFWIATGAARDKDLLVIGRDLFRAQSGLVVDVAQRLKNRHDKVVFVVSSETDSHLQFHSRPEHKAILEVPRRDY